MSIWPLSFIWSSTEIRLRAGELDYGKQEQKAKNEKLKRYLCAPIHNFAALVPLCTCLVRVDRYADLTSVWFRIFRAM